MFSKSLYMLFISLYAVLTQSARNRFHFDILNLTCPRYSERFKLLECKSSHKQPGNSTVNIRFMFDRDMGKDMEMQIKLFVKPINVKSGLKLIDYKFNVCVALNEIFSNKLLKGIMDDVRTSSNLPFKCPIKANYLYQIHNMPFNTKSLPAYTPSLNATVTLSFYNRNELLTEVETKSSITPIK